LGLYLVSFTIHSLELFIGFRNFRATVLLSLDNKEIMNDGNGRYPMHKNDKNVQEYDATKDQY
jgi:hypothetical protein